MGEVWKARQKETGRLVAIKTLSSVLAKQQDFVRRFEKEATALAALSHPGIVGIVASGFSEGSQTWYLAMELCEGDSLRELMRSGRINWREGARVIARVCRAMDHAHAHGVIHRDLKPENILVGQDGEPKVVDFGLAGMPADERMNMTGAAMAMGTANYMAPEQRSDARSVDARADVYSLGVILYELLVGEIPAGRFKLPSQLRKGIDPRIDTVVARALEPEASARLPSAGEMAFELERILASETPKPGQPKTTSQILSADERVASRENLRPVIGAIAIVIGIVGALLLSHPWSRQASRGLPQDTMGTLGVRLERQGGELRLGFQPGREMLYAYNGEWSLKDGSLVARVFGDGPKPAARPFAILDAGTIRADGLVLEAELTLDPTPPKGHRSKEPARAELALQGDSGTLLALEARLGPGQLSLVQRSRSGAEKVLGTAEAPLKPGEPVRLRLAVVDGQLEASAGQREPLDVVLREPLPQAGFVGRPALVCSEATCRFRSWRIASTADQRGRAGR
jgi:serine/threonine-protein kinase